MNSNSKDALQAIPDFTEFMKLIDEIGELSFKKMVIEKDIKGLEAWTVREVTTNPEFFVGGKPQSMSFIESTYKYTGIDNSLLEKRTELADVTAMLEKRKLMLSVFRDMIEVWRTLSSNERSASL